MSFVRPARRCRGLVVVAAAWLAHAAAFAQLTGNPPPAEFNPWRVALGTLLVALLAVVAVVVLRRPGAARLLRAPAGGDTLRVVSRASLDARNSVAVVETHGRRWLVGAGPQGPALLAELPQPEPGRQAAQTP